MNPPKQQTPDHPGPSAGPFVLALDLGTSSVRSAVFNPAGLMVSSTLARSPGALQTASDGTAQMDPSVLLDAAEMCLASTLRAWRDCPEAEGRAHVHAVGVSCFWHSLLGLRGGNPVTPLYTWADARARSAAGQLRLELEETRVHSRTGAMLRAAFWPAKLRWLKSTGLHNNTDLWCGPAEWIMARLFGRPLVCGLSMASGTGLLQTDTTDGRASKWDDALCAACGVAVEELPPVDDDPHPATPPPGLLSEALGGVPVAPPLGDGAASNLGSGAARPGVAALNFGTSAAVRIVSSQNQAPPPGLFRFLLDHKRRVYGGAVSNAGNLHRWAMEVLRLPDHPAALDAAIQSRPQPVEDLLVLPFLVSERSPTWPEGQRAVWTGLSSATTAIEIYLASMDAVLQRLAGIYEVLPRENNAHPRVIATGGSTASSAFLQRLATVFGVDIEAGAEPEASLRGAAVSAFEAIGHQVPCPPPGPRIACDRLLHERFLAMRPQYAELEKLFTLH